GGVLQEPLREAESRHHREQARRRLQQNQASVLRLREQGRVEVEQEQHEPARLDGGVAERVDPALSGQPPQQPPRGRGHHRTLPANRRNTPHRTPDAVTTLRNARNSWRGCTNVNGTRSPPCASCFAAFTLPSSRAAPRPEARAVTSVKS